MPTKNSTVNTNPTAYFLNQATETSKETREKINEYVKTLINLKSCVLCKEDYDFSEKIPRILVHCGHTICTQCLRNFHKNRRIRCPLCLKLIKNIDTLDRLPVNHTIFSKMMEERKDEFRQVTGRQGRFSDFTKTSMPSRDAKQRDFEPEIDFISNMAKAAKPDTNKHYDSKELFGAGKYEQPDMAKKVDWGLSQNMSNGIKLKKNLIDYKDLFGRDDVEVEDIEAVDDNILDKKFELPEFDFGNHFYFLRSSFTDIMIFLN